jgi:hypothetical protein
MINSIERGFTFPKVKKMPNLEPFERPTIKGRLEAPGVKWHRDAQYIIPLWLADQDYPLCP